MKRLYDRLWEYSESDYYGFHMPGHKRNNAGIDAQLPYRIDITEIDGFDDLNHPRDILKEAQEQAAKVYHAEETRFLVNGSTVGLLASIMAITDRGDEILVARNCHKSVYHGIELQGLHPIYLYPFYDAKAQMNGDISPKHVDNLLKKHPDVKGVVITSPTYEGILSNIEEIAKIAHARRIPLIVDEAHGAHFGMHPYFPQNANKKGADLVIHSLHKTMPSLTQTALLHRNGELVDMDEVDRYLRMLQTSSPSYVLMASIDACVDQMEQDGETYFTPYVEMLKWTREELGKLKHIHLEQCGQSEDSQFIDKSKLVLSVCETPWNGRELCEILRERYHLELEMAAGSYAIAMTGPGDRREGMRRLVDALKAIDDEVDQGSVQTEKSSENQQKTDIPVAKQIYASAHMRSLLKQQTGREERITWKESEGYISTEYAYLYPPGIPILVPGEQISAEIVELLNLYESQGFQVEGCKEQGKIGVWIGE